MHPEREFSDDDIKRRFKVYYGEDSRRNLSEGQIPFLRNKWVSLSEYIKEIKQTFSRYYNRLHNRRGFFWADRFKSILVDNGDTLINCLAYIDFNPIRAGIVERPEEYRWCSLGYHIQSGNKEDFLSLDFGLRECGVLAKAGRLAHYRRFVYEKGGLSFRSSKGEVVNASAVFRSRIRYFIDGGMIGTEAFVMKCYRMFRGHFSSRREKEPIRIKTLEGIYSLKRLSG